METMYEHDPLNGDMKDILDKIAEDGEEDADIDSVYEWIAEEREFDWRYPNAFIDNGSDPS